jgi:hypothetical protein
MSSNPFKVGDIVRIKSRDFLDKIYNGTFDWRIYCDSVVCSMLPFAGDQVIVNRVNGRCVNMTDVPCNWDYQWLEPAKSPKGNIMCTEL